MPKTIPAAGLPNEPRRRKWLRWLGVVVAVYLVCWAVTWALAPAAPNRWWARWAENRQLAGPLPWGGPEPVELHTGVTFRGQGLHYEPVFAPQGGQWCCVGRPWCPAPFVVASEVAWRTDPLAGFAGKVYFTWTPFGMVPIYERRVRVV